VRLTLTGPADEKSELTINWPKGTRGLEILPTDYDEAIRTMESWSRVELVNVLTKAGLQPKAMPGGVAKVDAEVHALLGTWNELAQYEAVRLLHQQRLERGESPELLGALVRGYSHLGQLCRYHDSAAESVFHARALLYSQRLAVQFPSREALAHRVYAKVFAGLESAWALDEQALAQAAGDAPPAWLEPIRRFAQFEPAALEADANPATASLSAFLRFVLAERSRNAIYMQPRFDALMARQPLCLRAIDSMADLRPIGTLHVMTTLGPQKHVQAIVQLLPSIPDLPADALTAAKRYSQATWPNLPVPALTAALRSAAANDTHEPSWAVLASLVEAPHVRQVYRRAAFMKFSWSVPADEFLDAALPSLQGHHLEPVFRALKLDPRAQAKQIDQIMSKVDLQDLKPTFHLLMDRPWWGKTAQGVPIYSRWWMKLTSRSNLTADDLCLLAIYLTWGEKPNQQQMTRLMRQVCPRSPITQAMIARTDEWADVERASAGWSEPPLSEDPTLLWAWSNRLIEQEQFEAAQARLEQYVKISPDVLGYEKLAEIYDRRGNLEQWLATMNRYLDAGEDTGLGRAQIARTIAYRLLSVNRLEEAVDYAERSAESWSAWGLQTAATANERLDRWNRANMWMRQRAERYPNYAPDWYLWCRRTGQGDVAAARQAAQAYFKELGEQLAIQTLLQRGMFQMLEMNLTAARDDFESAYGLDLTQPYPGLMAAILSHKVADAERRNRMLAQMRVEWAPALSMDGRLMLENVVLLREYLAGRQPKFDRESFDARLKRVAAARQLDVLYCTSQVLGILKQPAMAEELLQRCAAPLEMATEDSSRVLAMAELHHAGFDAKARPMPRLEEPASIDVKRQLQKARELQEARKQAESLAVLISIIDQVGHQDAVARMAMQLHDAGEVVQALPYAEYCATRGDAAFPLLAARSCEATGRLERADAWMQRHSELVKQGDDRWYFWCRRTNYGNLDQARASAKRALLDQQIIAQNMPRRVVYYMLEGQLKEAQAILDLELENKQGWAGIYLLSTLDPATSGQRMKEILLQLGGPDFRTSDFSGFGSRTRTLARRFADTVRDSGKPMPTIDDIEKLTQNVEPRFRVDAWYFASQAYRALGQADAVNESLARCITPTDTETVSQVLAYTELRKRGRNPMTRIDAAGAPAKP
jgi:hypothetical protein